MHPSFPVLFAILIAVPGLLIPLFVIGRMRAVLGDASRTAGERTFARGTVLLMLLLMAFSVYAALEVFGRLSALAALGS